MYDSQVFDKPNWSHSILPYISPIIGEDKGKEIVDPLMNHYIEMNKLREKTKAEVDEDEGEELCNCEFSLAYGGMILLNNTKLRLTRGQRYGLCGPNGYV